MEIEMVLMLGMMLMMISMMPVTMMMTMATISPSGRGFPRQNLPAGDGFSLCRFLSRGGGKTRKLFYIQGFYPRGVLYPGFLPHEASRRVPGVARRRGRARHPSGFLVGPLTSILGDPQSIS